MKNTSKVILGSMTVAATALATTGLLMNKDKIAKMAQDKMNAIEDAKDDVVGGMKEAAKDLKGMMK